MFGVSAPSEGHWLEGTRTQGSAAAVGLGSMWSLRINTDFWH